MSTLGGVVISTVLVAALVSLIVVGTTTDSLGVRTNNRNTKAPLEFPGPTISVEEDGFQECICGCKLDWMLNTTERAISNDKFAQMSSIPDPHGLSSLVGFWGQFIDHDIVHSESDPEQTAFQIPLVPTDAVITVSRAKFRPTAGGCREPTNVLSPFIDGSGVYGDYRNPNVIDSLRIPNSCIMNTSDGNLLPLKGDNTFLAGDDRNSEHSFLTALHTLWVREHNRLCEVLAIVEPGWSEDERFWKARQVVVAKIQKITYEEFLPALFGSQAGLLIPGVGVEKGTRGRITSEFAVVAYRFGHSLIPDPIGPFTLPSLFFNAQMIIDNGIEPFFTAAYATPAERVDIHIIDGLRNFLFSVGPGIMGEDLVTRNLFRARELGMPSYAGVAQCFDLPAQNDAEDSYAGLLMEPLVQGSSLPRTIAHILAEQFRRTRKYDPNFYTTVRFSLNGALRNELDATTLARVIVANTALTSVPSNVFRV